MILKCNTMNTENQKLTEKIEACKQKLINGNEAHNANAILVEKYNFQIRELEQNACATEQKIVDLKEDIEKMRAQTEAAKTKMRGYEKDVECTKNLLQQAKSKKLNRELQYAYLYELCRQIVQLDQQV